VIRNSVHREQEPILSIVEVRDHALWAKHIHSNEQPWDKVLGPSQEHLY
jgi:hypothetical protein